MDNKHPYVGYVVKRYPRFSETFIVNEILAHERAGMKLDIFALGDVQEAFSGIYFPGKSTGNSF